jgi:hypothetical protein
LTFSISFYKPFLYNRIISFLKEGNWGSIKVLDSYVLFKKGSEKLYPLVKVYKEQSAGSHLSGLIIDKNIELTSYDAFRQPDLFRIVFYWKSLHKETKDINYYLDFINKDGKLIDRQYRASCYRIWPTQAWDDTGIIKEYLYVSIPKRLQGRVKDLKIGFYDYKNGSLIPDTSKDILGRITIDASPT